MSAVGKMRHIEAAIPVTLRPDTPRKVLLHLRPFMVKPGDALVDIASTEWYKGMDKRMRPGDYLRVVRGARGMTQREVGEHLGVKPQFVHDCEAGLRGISKANAKKLAALLGLPLERLL